MIIEGPFKTNSDFFLSFFMLPPVILGVLGACEGGRDWNNEIKITFLNTSHTN